MEPLTILVAVNILLPVCQDAITTNEHVNNMKLTSIDTFFRNCHRIIWAASDPGYPLDAIWLARQERRLWQFWNQLPNVCSCLNEHLLLHNGEGNPSLPQQNQRKPQDDLLPQLLMHCPHACCHPPCEDWCLHLRIPKHSWTLLCTCHSEDQPDMGSYEHLWLKLLLDGCPRQDYLPPCVLPCSHIHPHKEQEEVKDVPKLFDITVSLLFRVLPHCLLCGDDKAALPLQALPGLLQRISKAFETLPISLWGGNSHCQLGFSPSSKSWPQQL